MRGATILWAILATIAGTGLFLLKYEVQAQEERLANLRKDIVDTEQSIHVLKAEWSYLNDPVRLRDLAERHLGLHPIKPTQIAAIDSLPMATDQVADQSPQPAETPAAAPQVTAKQGPARPVVAAAVARPTPAVPAAIPLPAATPARPAKAKATVVARHDEPSKKVAAVVKPAPRPAAPVKLATAIIPARRPSAYPAMPIIPAAAPAVATQATPAIAGGADVMVIKSPALLEPEIAGVRGRP